MTAKPVFSSINRRVLLAMAATVAITFGLAPTALTRARAQTNPLPSWNEGATKQAITDFVARVTRHGGPDFVLPAERIATTTGPYGSSIRCTSNWPSRSIA